MQENTPSSQEVSPKAENTKEVSPKGGNIKKEVPLRGPSSNSFYLSIAALVIVAAICLYFFISAKVLNGQNTTLQTDISYLTQEVQKAQNKSEIVIAKLLAGGHIRPSIHLEPLVNDFRIAAKTSGVYFEGFNVANDTLTTQLTSSSVSANAKFRDPVTSIIDIMRKYTEKNNEKQPFTLEPLVSVSGTPQARTTMVIFKLIPPSSQKEETPTTGTGEQNPS